MRIGVVGGGTVGRATARAFIEHVDEVCVYDVVKERRTHGFDEVLMCGLIFLCLPTPQKDGQLACDTSTVDKFFHQLEVSWGSWNWKQKNWVLRSTVPIGTTRKLCEKYNLPNLVHSPEFLTARCAIQDAQMPARNIIGWSWTAGETASDKCLWTLKHLYESRFPGIPIYEMSSDESEAVKLFQNSFFAVKVAFWNECRALSDKLGMDWERVLEAVLADGRIGHSHTKVPGPDGKRGYGGLCLPKDLANFISCFDDMDARIYPQVSVAAYNRNLLDRGESNSMFVDALKGTLSDAETWERLNVDRLQLDKGLSIGESMPESEMMREAIRNPFDQ